MGLSNLIREGEERLPDPISVRLDAMTLAKVDEIVDEFGVTRASVVREATAVGMCQMMEEWNQAQQNAKKKGGKKSAAA